MVKAFHGTPGLPAEAPADRLGTLLLLSTAGVTIACLFAASTASRRESLLRVLAFPPLTALMLAVLLAPVGYPAWPAGMLRRLGDTVVPLALVSVGCSLGCQWRSGKTALATLFEAAMGPQTGGTAAAMQRGLGPAIIAITVGLGMALSLLPPPPWHLHLAMAAA